MTLEQSIEYFSILGGMEESIDLDFFEDLFSMVKSNFVDHFSTFQSLVSPSYLLETPYREILSAVARGDGKFYSVLRKARLSEGAGEEIIKELVSSGILYIEPTREQPLRIHPKHKLKKELRSYRIQDKLRFCKPFMRFWFGFVTYYRKDLLQGNGTLFLENFESHYERLRSLVYEQLCNDMLWQYYSASTTPLLSNGSYWDQHSEFDLLAVTADKKLILGECKYKERKVCKNELSKLKAKAEKSSIAADIYVLFSKNGFSNELLQMQDEKLLLFDLNDLKILL
ncbi:DUF234 domain-containing protein [Sulfurovum riftiae]|uniref:DUF234 domain-containing protein n=1 Tax=Sulfurovum riftiae TaxID=1630136 RepID=A0A151CIZ4_9BACT|nr:DUF234 domain-containing protein [Sulfurovum riftiae]KYJ87496.1 hypothetical protein AS592_10320 [Sulfurovum riftiae]